MFSFLQSKLASDGKNGFLESSITPSKEIVSPLKYPLAMMVGE